MSKTTLIIWGAALFVYALFLGWHENWRGPLSEAEIKSFMARIEATENLDDAQRKTLLAFMQTDTGDEFLMVNLIAHKSGKIVDPIDGQLRSAEELLGVYVRPFIGKLVRSAGYPVVTGPAQGGYLDAWNVEANPGWSGSGLVRYRSRRDMLEAATDPSFAGGHVYKQAALAATLAVPIDSSGGLFLSPRIWLAMVLTLLAAFGQITYLVLRIKNDPKI